MSSKVIELAGVGPVKFFKRRGTKSIRITLTPENQVRVTMPLWLPYTAGIQFVKSKHSWVEAHKKQLIVLSEGASVGKAHRLYFTKSNNLTKPTVRIKKTEIHVLYATPYEPPHPEVQTAAKRGIYRALKKEAESLLPQRLRQLADVHGFSYVSVTCKRMRSRWGSCNQQQGIALNIFLMQLPWQLIDYVLIHELVHTKYLNHGQDFWSEFERCLPKAKIYKKTLKTYQPTI